MPKAHVVIIYILHQSMYSFTNGFDHYTYINFSTNAQITNFFQLPYIKKDTNLFESSDLSS